MAADEPASGGVLGRAKASLGEVGVGLYSLVLCFGVLVATGLVGVAREEPWVFPSLGPTLMLFFETPRAPTASVRNTVVGHLVGMTVGAACLYGLGLDGRPSAPVEGLDATLVLAAASSVAITALVLRGVRCPHPPAGATTLIVSLGILQTGTQLRTMVLAVLLVTALGFVVNRLLGSHHGPDRDAGAPSPITRR